MKLLIIRHGTAQPVSDRFTEENRPLTDQGIAEAATTGKYVRSLASSCRAVWSSPYERAQQTAEHIARNFADPQVITYPFLMPDEDPIRATGAISECVDELETLCVVGHQPQMGRLIGSLCHANEHGFDIPPATVVEIHLDRDRDNPRLLHKRLCGFFQVRHMQI